MRIVNKKIEIDPERAVIICKIFQWYLDGISKEQIAHKLNEAGVLSNQNKAWRAGGIHYVLTNERYIGDSLWQKTYTTEAIPTVRHRNTGAREQYYNEQTKANQRILDAAQTLENASPHITEWDESAVRQLVETVKVLSKDEITVTLKGGFEIRQKIMY